VAAAPGGNRDNATAAAETAGSPAARENPLDAGSGLVYADWLEERGRDEGELMIRGVVCRPAGMAIAGPRTVYTAVQRAREGYGPPRWAETPGGPSCGCKMGSWSRHRKVGRSL
jgi:uncharacterized protein (TIGR02996 family)